VTATPFIDSTIHIGHYIVSNVKIHAAVLLDAGIKNPKSTDLQEILRIVRISFGT
jgi:hypothetical protein